MMSAPRHAENQPLHKFCVSDVRVSKKKKPFNTAVYLKMVIFSIDMGYHMSFPKEIDAITTQPAQESGTEASAPAPTPPRPEPKTDQQTQEFQYNTQYSLAGGTFSS